MNSPIRAATSSGNAGAAMAAYGVRAGVKGYLFTLEKASRAKIAQIMAYGPQVMAVERMGLSARAYQRILKLSRTIADLAGSEQVLQYRSRCVV